MHRYSIHLRQPCFGVLVTPQIARRELILLFLALLSVQSTRAPFCAEFVIFSTPPKSPPARNFTHQRKRCCWLPPAYARILCASAKECTQTCARARSDTRARCVSRPPPPTSRRRLFSLWRLCDHTNQPRIYRLSPFVREHTRAPNKQTARVREQNICAQKLYRVYFVCGLAYFGWAKPCWIWGCVVQNVRFGEHLHNSGGIVFI